MNDDTGVSTEDDLCLLSLPVYNTMLMHLFRKTLDLNQAAVRSASEADYYRIGGLLRQAGRHYYGVSGGELPLLLATVPAVVLEAGEELWGAVVSGWRAEQATWLRCVALARGLDTTEAMLLLLPALHTELRQRRLRHIFYAGDETADAWLLPTLRQYGYVTDTTVVVYEKHALTIPARGNEQLQMRPAQASDLPTLVELDRHCFESHWTMHESTLHAAIQEHAFFAVGEMDGRIIGYTYATSHFGGRLVHLVRIAVDPRQRHQHIGTRLLAEVIVFAQQQRASLVTLNTQSYNERAQRLYRWFGFAPNGEYQTVLRYDL